MRVRQSLFSITTFHKEFHNFNANSTRTWKFHWNVIFTVPYLSSQIYMVLVFYKCKSNTDLKFSDEVHQQVLAPSSIPPFQVKKIWNKKNIANSQFQLVSIAISIPIFTTTNWIEILIFFSRMRSTSRHQGPTIAFPSTALLLGGFINLIQSLPIHHFLQNIFLSGVNNALWMFLFCHFFSFTFHLRFLPFPSPHLA